MDRSIMAALLSALVFPGAGHLYLRRMARGCIFLVPALAASIYFFDQLVKSASAVVDQVLAGTVALDPVLIAAKLENQGGAGSPLTTLAVVVMIACWAGSIVDSFLIARAQRSAAPVGDSKRR
jgi:multisubunit Na+/H+ antiporter MnhE subunit